MLLVTSARRTAAARTVGHTMASLNRTVEAVDRPICCPKSHFVSESNLISTEERFSICEYGDIVCRHNLKASKLS